MNRRNQILAGVLVLQVVLMVVAFWPRGGAAGATGQALFPGLEADQITALTVTGSDGKSTRLVRAEGGGWVLPEAGDYPVKADAVPALLGKIVALKAQGAVTTSSASLKRLKVAPAEFERLVEFELADGTRHQLFLGTSPSYGAVHVRADKRADVYLAQDLVATDAGAQASDWIDRTYLSLAQDQIAGFTLENMQGIFVLEKDGENWTLQGLGEGETLDQNTVRSLVSRVSALSIQRPLGKQEKPEYGMDDPGAVVTVRTTDGKTTVLTVGAQDPDDKTYVVRSSESAYFVRVSEYSGKDLVQKDRAGLLVQPTPTPEPSATPGG